MGGFFLLAKEDCGPISGPSKVIAESEQYQKLQHKIHPLQEG